MMLKIYENDNYIFTVTPDDNNNKGILFVNHEKNLRSGHIGHGMAQYAHGKILCFYSDCDIQSPLSIDNSGYTDNIGHSGVGWCMLKRSEDGGLSWSEAEPLAYSIKAYVEHTAYVFCEKAVAFNGVIIAMLLVCDPKTVIWDPYMPPVYIRSSDGGRTWSESAKLCESFGRVYDLKVHNSKIYCLMGNGIAANEYYSLFISDDGGRTFIRQSDFSFTQRFYYGNIEWLKDGKLAVYVYKFDDERNMLVQTSADDGITWNETQTVYFKQRLRNQQIIRFKDAYFAFGRSGSEYDKPDAEPELGHIIVYASDDGINWNDGHILRYRDAKHGAYSNCIIINALDGRERILFQASHAYSHSQTNILHWFIDAENSVRSY